MASNRLGAADPFRHPGCNDPRPTYRAQGPRVRATERSLGKTHWVPAHAWNREAPAREAETTPPHLNPAAGLFSLLPTPTRPQAVLAEESRHRGLRHAKLARDVDLPAQAPAGAAYDVVFHRREGLGERAARGLGR